MQVVRVEDCSRCGGEGWYGKPRRSCGLCHQTGWEWQGGVIELTEERRFHGNPGKPRERRFVSGWEQVSDGD